MSKVVAKNYFDSDDDDENSEEEEESKLDTLKTNKPYEENFNKFVRFYNEYVTKTDEIEGQLFHAGSHHVNHPLLEFSMLVPPIHYRQNFEKNVGLFDVLKLKKGSQQIFERTAVLFSYLESEVLKIRELLESTLIQHLVMYGERAQNVQLAEGEAELQIARMITTFKKVYDIIRKIMSYVEHTMVQLHCIFNKKEQLYKVFKNIGLWMPVWIMGKALRMIYLIDCVVNNNPYLLDHWNQYKKLVKAVRTEPQKFGSSVSSAKKMEKLTLRLDNTLLSGKCFETVISMQYDKYFQTTKSELGLFKNNKELREFFEQFFQEHASRLSETIGLPTEREERTKLLELMCVYAFFRKVYPSDEMRDLWKTLWEAQRQIPIIEGYSHVTIYISDFLTNVCPLSRPSKTKDPRDPQVFLKEYTTKIDSLVATDVNSLYTQTCVWFSRMDSVVTSNYAFGADTEKIKEKTPQKLGQIILERLVNRLNMLCSGVQLIAQLRRIVHVCMMLHMNEEIGFGKGLLGYLILGLQSMKAIQQIFRDKAQAFDTTLLTLLIARDIQRILRPIHDRLEREEAGRKKSEKLDYIAAMKTILRIIGGPISQLKLSILRYSLCFISKGFLKENEINDLRRGIDKLEVVNNRLVLLQKYGDCSFLYSCKQILTSFFEFKRNNPNTCKRMQFLFNSFEDASAMISRCNHLEDNKEVFIDYKQFFLKNLEQAYMLPLRREIEDFLRINTHFMLIEKLENQNPFKTEAKDLLKLIHLEKLRIFDSIIDIRAEISKSFNESFYNLNALNMYNMETYEHIRTMGNYLFGLQLHHVYLPSHTIDQNLFDILQVLRTIPAFVDKYKYNLFSQTFLEITGEGKTITSIGIKQLADSIKTHGLGILSTTVNAFYKFLIKKIKAFNKFLFDDLIQSPLAAERNWLKKAVDREDYPGFYPYQRAEIFYEKIKKLGRLEDEKTFLDKFRILITSVGNVLGFVRLLRTASLNYSSKNVEFLPKKMQMDQGLADLAEKTTLSEAAVEACTELDEIFRSLEESFTDRTDYLSVLVRGFRKIATKQNKHLRQFYLMLPALTINYVESVLAGKEQITKRISTKAFISDDGFALGIAYFLALLKQNEHYQSLHWKMAVLAKFKEDIEINKDFTERVDKSKKVNEDMLMQKQLSLRMLTMQQEQFELLDYTLTSAKVLFKEQPEAPQKAQDAEGQEEQEADQ